MIIHGRPAQSGGFRVERLEQLDGAVSAALACGKPAVIEVRIDPQAITPNTTLDAIRASARK